MDEARLRPLLRLLLAPGMNSAAAARLLRCYEDDPDRILRTGGAELAWVQGVGPALAAAVAHAAATEAEADREAARARDLGLSLVGPGDEGYPTPLLHSYDPPPMLYVRGRWEAEDAVSVAVVGSRRATPYGLQQAGRLARDLAGAGLTVVSGMARGIDTEAHRGALLAEGGRTVGVLGSGHARPYPSENVRLMEAAAERGALISEFPLDAPPLPHNFPRRNRVLAAMTMGTLVVEASEKSGSLITAYLALEAGREVMAVPGRIDSENSRGVHRLLREGAALVEDAGDVLRALDLEELRAPAEVPVPVEGLPGRVLRALEGEEPRDADEVAAVAGVTGEEARAALVDLELEGRVRAFPGGRYLPA